MSHSFFFFLSLYLALFFYSFPCPLSLSLCTTHKMQNPQLNWAGSCTFRAPLTQSRLNFFGSCFHFCRKSPFDMCVCFFFFSFIWPGLLQIQRPWYSRFFLTPTHFIGAFVRFGRPFKTRGKVHELRLRNAWAFESPLFHPSFPFGVGVSIQPHWRGCVFFAYRSQKES